MKTNSNFKRICIDAVTMLLVAGLSLLLLMYVGFGEAQRTFQQFHVEKLTAQARVVQRSPGRCRRHVDSIGSLLVRKTPNPVIPVYNRCASYPP